MQKRLSETISDDLKLGKIRYVGWSVFKDVGLYLIFGGIFLFVFIDYVFREHEMHHNDHNDGFDTVGKEMVITKEIFRINDIEAQDKVYDCNDEAGCKAADTEYFPVSSAKLSQ